jgi:hypothetical protein
MSEQTLIGLGLYGANPFIWERVGQHVIDSMPAWRPRRQGKPARDAPPPDYVLNLEVNGIEDRVAFPAEEADAWHELVTRASQALGMPYHRAEHLEHVLRVLPSLVRELFLALPPPFYVEVAEQTSRRPSHGLRLNRFWRLIAPLVTALSDRHRNLTPDPDRFWSGLSDKLRSIVVPITRICLVDQADWFADVREEAGSLRRRVALTRCASLAAECEPLLPAGADEGLR